MADSQVADDPAEDTATWHEPGVDSGQLFVTELLYREGRFGADSGGPSRTYRLFAAAVGIVLVCGIVTAAAALSGPRADRGVVVAADHRHITGPDVLRPALIRIAMGRPGAGSRPPARDERVAPAGGGGLGEALDPVADPVLDPVLRLVTTFYQTAPTAPIDAYHLLSADMQQPGYDAFADSWSGIEQLSVDGIRRDAPDAALVAVTLERADGTVLHTLQRVVVSGGAAPVIGDATLLSASVA
ncbi:MAG: hypothetical protein ACRDT0_26815 [Pseudonocardiaceae bacterium]